MSKLDELIRELCPDGVIFVPLGEVLKNNNASESIEKKDYKEFGRIPIIDQSQAYIAAYTDNESAMPPILPCIIFGDHTRIVKYAKQKFAQGDSGTKVFIPVSNDIDTKFIYYAFCNLSILSRGYNRHWSVVKELRIPLPPLPVQREIVRILDSFTELTAELTTELTARKKQYEYYRDELFNFKEQVEWKNIGEITRVFSASRVHKDEWTTEGVPFFRSSDIISLFNGVDNSRGRVFISNELYEALSAKSGKFRKDDILITGGGTIGIPYIVPSDEPIYVKDADLLCIQKSENLNSRFLYHYFLTTAFRQYLSNVTHDATIAHYTISQISSTSVPIPSLEEQSRIISILDRFDTLCNDITTGLPAEIEARKKQYEYYRDKLLSFPEVNS